MKVTNKQAVNTWVMGPWKYWPDSGKLKNSDQEHRLPTQLNQVLKMLVTQAPAVVTRQQFLEQVWAGKIVNEEALSRTVAELRKTLGDSAAEAKYIKTIPKQGYQLTHVVEPLSARRHRTGYYVLAVLLAIGVVWLTWNMSRDDEFQRLQQAVANAQRVTADPGMEQQSRLSENGEWLSYIKITDQSRSVMIQSLLDTNTSKTVDLPRHNLASPVFLPDSEVVFFLAKDQRHCYLKQYSFKTRLFTDWGGCVFNGESRTLDWHADSGQLLMSFPDAQQKVAIHSLSWPQGERLQLTFPENADESDWSPRISPDQQWLSFSRGNQSVRNLWLTNRQSGTSFAITHGKNYTVSHDWYDDEHIVFDSDLNGSRQLWLINIHDQQPRMLGAYGGQHPSFDAKHQNMTFQLVSYEANIWLYDRSNGDFERLIHSTKYDNYPAFSPDGNRFVFSSNRQDQSAIWIYDLSSQKEQMLLSIPGVKLTRPSWSLDGQSLLVTTNDDSGYGSIQLDIHSGQWQDIDFGMNHMSTQASTNGLYTLAKSTENDNRILYQADGKISTLPMAKVSRFRVLADGRLIYSKVDADGLYLFDPQRQDETAVVSQFPRTSLNLWTTTEQGIYYDVSGQQSGVWRHDLSTGEKHKVTHHRPYSVGTSLSVSPNENHLLITRTDRAESDVLRSHLE